MWFKQIKLFQITDSLQYSADKLTKKLEALAFQPCTPSMPFSMGWVSPIDEEGAPLFHIIDGNIMICLLVEEKILPAFVVNQELAKKVKHIEKTENRKVYRNEKLNLKDEIIVTLLPRAFSKLTRIYGYLDTKNNWLVLGTALEKKAEQFLTIFKKSISENIHAFQLKKLSTAITDWIKQKNYPDSFSIEKTCMLQDPNQKNRIIRCQQQDLFTPSIQSLIKDGFAITQLALAWQDCVQFTLIDDFSLRTLKFKDQVIAQAKEMEPETLEQQFNADFLIMSQIFSSLLRELLSLFLEPVEKEKSQTIPRAHLHAV